MTPGYILFLLSLVIAQIALPKRYGFAPLLLAACHLGNIEALPEITATRLIILVGLIRAVTGNLFVWSAQSSLDRLFALFAGVCVLSSFGHTPDPWSPSPFAAHVGLALNVVGAYLYGRAYIPTIESFNRYTRLMLIILIPLAVVMLFEMRTGKNLYFLMGSKSENSATREDKIRAQGPFRGANTAGCVGATALPFIFLPWVRGRKRAAIVGAAACMGVTIACNSSGPLSAVAVTFAAIALWRYRQHLSRLLWVGVFVGILYYVFKGRGPWYLMARIDLTGGSTGYYRAELIDAGISHLSEWWLTGTDHTRHWMPTGVSWSPNHTDMTNYYLHLGVIGGLALTLLLFGMLAVSFRLLAQRMVALREHDDPDQFVLWAAGTALAAHAVSFIAISYYDQMYVFFYVLLGAIPGLCATAGSSSATAADDNPSSLSAPEAAQAPLVPRYYS